MYHLKILEKTGNIVDKIGKVTLLFVIIVWALVMTYQTYPDFGIWSLAHIFCGFSILRYTYKGMKLTP